jgi:hypothetical protein
MSTGKKLSTGFTGHDQNFDIHFGSAVLRSNFDLTLWLAVKFTVGPRQHT